jgi:hypothetical protein
MKIITESGQLNLDGNVLTIEFKDCLDKIMRQPEVLEMTTNELQILGSCLAKMVGETITNKIAAKAERVNQFIAMSDQEFEDYLQKKYGNNWAFTTLTEEEYQRVPTISAEDIRKCLEENNKSFKLYHQSGVVFPKLYRQ